MHHRLSRRHGDHTAGNLAHLCAACHDWVHGTKNRRAAEDAGWIVRSTA